MDDLIFHRCNQTQATTSVQGSYRLSRNCYRLIVIIVVIVVSIIAIIIVIVIIVLTVVVINVVMIVINFFVIFDFVSNTIYIGVTVVTMDSRLNDRLVRPSVGASTCLSVGASIYPSASKVVLSAIAFTP